MKKIIVVGAGAAGIIAAWKAADTGAKVILLEKKERIGFKILISGGGRCNITHDGNIPSLLHQFRPNEADFLRPSFHIFTNQDICRLIESKGIALTTREDGRVFPQNATAKEVVGALESILVDVGVELRTLSHVSDIRIDSNRIQTVSILPSKHIENPSMESLRMETDCVILCTGGLSYPGTGSTGDGWKWLAQMGHTIVKPRASLAPIFLDVAPPSNWAGISLRNVILKARQHNRVITKSEGDILFTHRGISGPASLEISRVMAERRSQGEIELIADLSPKVGYEMLKERVMEWIQKHPRKTLIDLAEEFAPSRVAEVILERASLSGVCGAQISRENRNRFIEEIKSYRIGTVQHVPMEKGEVTAGGVDLAEVDPRTMESRFIRGLYLCGELLDIAGPIGGYNLQAAFSTGYVAGMNAAILKD